MFVFNRRRRDERTEIFDICLPENAIENAEERFGKALMFFRRDDKYHHLGWIVLLEAGEKDIKDETELFIGCKNLSDKEMEVLWREIEMLVGKNVHTFGGEPAVGWFMDDGLRSEDFTAEVIPAKSGIQEK